MDPEEIVRVTLRGRTHDADRDLLAGADRAVLVARGLPNGSISRSPSSSEKTVEQSVADLVDRLGVRTRSALATRVRGGPTPSES